MKIGSPSPLTGEGKGEGDSNLFPPHLNPLPRRGEEDFKELLFFT
jgi:hypothetical protein